MRNDINPKRDLAFLKGNSVVKTDSQRVKMLKVDGVEPVSEPNSNRQFLNCIFCYFPYESDLLIIRVNFIC